MEMNCSFILYLHSATLYYLSDTCTALDFIQCRSAQTNTEKCSAVHYGTIYIVQFRTPQWSAEQHSAVSSSAVQRSTVLYRTVQICECKSAHRIVMELRAPLVHDSCAQYSMDSSVMFCYVLSCSVLFCSLPITNH